MNAHTPMVSVVMAVYNSENYLQETLTSVLSQTLADIELICVDDGSTDGSLRILEAFAAKDDRMRVLHHTEQTDGAGAARNLGIAAAKGKYLAVWDADDVFDPDLLEKAVRHAEEQQAEIVLYDAWLYDDQIGRDMIVGYILSGEHLPRSVVFSGRENAEHLFQMTLGAAWNCLFLREFVVRERLRFESFHHADDLGFVYLAFALAHRIAPLREKLMHYRRNNDDSQSANVTRWPMSGYEALLRLKQELVTRGVYELYRNSFGLKAVEYLFFYLDKIRDEEAYRRLYTILQEKGWQELGAYDVPDTCFQGVHARFRFLLEQARSEMPMTFLLHRYQGTRPNGIFLRMNDAGMSMDRPVAVYGAGEHGRHVFSQLLQKGFPICAFVDRNYASIGFPAEAPERLKQVTFSCVLVTPADPRIYQSICRDLQAMGIPQEKIVWIGDC